VSKADVAREAAPALLALIEDYKRRLAAGEIPAEDLESEDAA
jgi:hypothetical protein